MVCNVIARYCKRIILSSSEISVNPNQYQCNNLLLSSGIEDNWRVAISPWVVLLRILEQMDQLHNLEYPVSILGVLASISRISTAITIILRDRPQISLPQFCDEVDEMFAEEPETSSSPQKLGDDADDQEEENGKGEDKLEKDDVVAVSNEKPDMTQNVNNAASSIQNAMGAPAGAGDEGGLKAKHRVDARPSLANHPDVSRPEFSNE